MNPSKSLMALFVAVSLTGASAARAADPWVSLQAGHQRFFLPKARYEAVKPGDSPEPLYFSATDPVDPDPKAKSIATLIKQKVKHTSQKKVVTYPIEPRINLLDAAHSYPVAATVIDANVTPVPLPPRAPTVLPPKPGRPSDVDEGIWNVVVSALNSAKVKADPDLAHKVALALQKDPADFQRLAASKKTLAAAVTHLGDMFANGATPADADIAKYLSTAGAASGAAGVPTSNPAGIGSTAVQAGTTGPAGQVGTGTTGSVPGSIVNGPDGKPLVVGDVLEHIGALLIDKKNSDFRKRVSDRFNEFIFDAPKTDDQAYIAKAELDKPGMTDRFKALSAKWIESSLNPDGKAAKPHDVAVLYFIMGDNKVPGSLTDADPLLLLLKDSDQRAAMDADKAPMLQRLVANMECYTNDAAGCKKNNPDQQSHGQFTGQSTSDDQATLDSWSTGFFHDASTYAQHIYSGLALSKVDLTKLVKQNDQPIVVPGVDPKPGSGVGGGSDAARIMSQGFNEKDLYENGAYVAHIPEPNGRKISIMMYTTREPVGTSGHEWQLVDKVGFYDITEPGDTSNPCHIYGKRVALAPPGESDVQLDDNNPNSISYHIKMGGDGTISITGKDGAGMATKLSDLYSRRSAQVATMPEVEINKQKYFVSSQGAPRGSYLYYATNPDGTLKQTDPAGRLSPALTVDGNQAGPSGFAQTLTDYQPMGYIGKNSAGKGQFYYLKWNTDMAKFEYKTCDEAKQPCQFPDVPAAPDTSTPSTKPGKGSTAPASTAPGTGSTAPAATTAPDGSTDDGSTAPDGGVNDPNNTGPSITKGCQPALATKLTTNYVAIKVAGWDIFLNNEAEQNAQKNLNVFLMCFSQTKTMMSQGILLGSKSIRDDGGDNMIFETVDLAAGTYANPDAIKNGKADLGSAQFTYGDGRPASNLGGRSVYYVGKKDLLKAVASDGTAQLSSVAWAKVISDIASGDAKAIDVTVSDVDPDKAVQLVGAALGLGNAAVSPANKDGKARILDEIKKDVTARKAQLSKPLLIHIDLYDPTEVDKLKTPSPVVTVGGQVILVFCHMPADNDKSKPRGLETPAEHLAHIKKDPS